MSEVKFSPDEVRDVSVAVYRILLDRDNSPGAADRMIAKDGDGGIKFRHRAGSYDRLSRAYMAALSKRKR